METNLGSGEITRLKNKMSTSHITGEVLIIWLKYVFHIFPFNLILFFQCVLIFLNIT